MDSTFSNNADAYPNSAKSIYFKKKSQISLIIFFGFLILIVFLILYYLMNTATINQTTQKIAEAQSIPAEKTIFETLLDSCVERVTDESLFQVGMEGGQTYLKATRTDPTNISPYGEVITPFFYQYIGSNVPVVYYYDWKTKNGYDFSYTDQDLARNLATKIDLNMPYCLQGFQDFFEEGYSVRYSGSLVEVTFRGNNTAYVKYSLNLSLTDPNGAATFKEFSSDYSVSNELQFFNNVNKLIIAHMLENVTDPDGRDMTFIKNSFPFFYMNELSDTYGFKYNILQDENSRMYVSLIKPTSIPRYAEEGISSQFISAYKFDWEADLNPFYAEKEFMPIAAEKDMWLEEDNKKYKLIKDPSLFGFDISPYFSRNYNGYVTYSDTFSINGETGILYPKAVTPRVGPHEIVVKAFNDQDSTIFDVKKFRVNVRDNSSVLPYIPGRAENSSVGVAFNFIAYRGFNFYQRIMASGTHGKTPLFGMYLPDALKNMSCGGNLVIDSFTGELRGKITAPPGTYILQLYVFQLYNASSMPYVNWNSTLTVQGNYDLGECE